MTFTFANLNYFFVLKLSKCMIEKDKIKNLLNSEVFKRFKTFRTLPRQVFRRDFSLPRNDLKRRLLYALNFYATSLYLSESKVPGGKLAGFKCRLRMYSYINVSSRSSSRVNGSVSVLSNKALTNLFRTSLRSV